MKKAAVMIDLFSQKQEIIISEKDQEVRHEYVTLQELPSYLYTLQDAYKFEDVLMIGPRRYCEGVSTQLQEYKQKHYAALPDLNFMYMSKF